MFSRTAIALLLLALPKIAFSLNENRAEYGSAIFCRFGEVEYPDFYLRLESEDQRDRSTELLYSVHAKSADREVLTRFTFVIGGVYSTYVHFEVNGRTHVAEFNPEQSYQQRYVIMVWDEWSAKQGNPWVQLCYW